MSKAQYTYQRLGAYHKARYKLYQFFNKVGLVGFPSEYWEPASAEAARHFTDSGYRLTKRGWVKR